VSVRDRLASLWRERISLITPSRFLRRNQTALCTESLGDSEKEIRLRAAVEESRRSQFLCVCAVPAGILDLLHHESHQRLIIIILIHETSMMPSISRSGILALAAASAIFLRQAHHSDAFAYVDQPDGGVPRMDALKKITAPRSFSPTPLLPDSETLVILAAFADRLADAARKEIKPYWRQGRKVLGQQIKAEEDRSVFQSASPVTLADRAAERAMRDLITEQYPDHGIYGEEYGIKDADADWVWCVGIQWPLK
jgi:hypothetical protein